MADQNRPAQSSPDSGEVRLEKKKIEISGANPADALDRKSSESEPKLSKPLTPEEQMELYEKDLKENDWGHQPC